MAVQGFDTQCPVKPLVRHEREAARLSRLVSMGDHRDQFFDLAASEESAMHRAAEVRAWLRANGWSTEKPELFDWLTHEDLRGEQTPADAIGPRVIAEFERTNPGWCYDPLTPVTVLPGWNAYYAAEGFEGIRCPHCGAISENAMQLIGEWDETRRVPEATCEWCEFRAPLIDWNLRDAVAFAWVGVIADLPDCEGALLPELQAALGGKWVHIHLHL